VERKREEVRGIIVQYMGEIHTISKDKPEAKMESYKADARFDEYKKGVTDSESLTNLDAMIRRIQVFAGQVLDRINALLSAGSGKNVIKLRRIDVISPRLLSTKEDIDGYANDIKEKLYEALEGNDGIQIN
jgi:hypothetical protein